MQDLSDQIFDIAVHYGRTLEQMIAVGRYAAVHQDLSPKYFRPEGEGIRYFETRLCGFGLLSPKEVAALQGNDAPWQPPKIEHLLAFGATHRHVLGKCSILAAGAAANIGGQMRVPYFPGFRGEARVGLAWWERGDDSYRYLAVRPMSAPRLAENLSLSV